MSTLVGMDTEVVVDLAYGLLADAERMDGVASQLRGTVGGLADTAWWGRDCVDFCATWQQVHDPALVAMAAKLRELGELALREAADQDRASGGTNAGSSIQAGVAALGANAGLGFAAVPVGGRHDRDLLAMSVGAYREHRDAVSETGGRYHRVEDRAELARLGVTPEMLRNDETGFSADILRGQDGSYVVAIRGSDGITRPDYTRSNIPNAMHRLSAQGPQALALAQRMTASVGTENVTFTGHSLAGHLASMAAISTGARAVTFNAAGVGDADFSRALIAGGRDGHVGELLAKQRAQLGNPWGPFHLYDPFAAERRAIHESGQIRNYSTRLEPLHIGQSLRVIPQALGVQVPMHDPNPSRFGRHGPDGLLETYDSSFRRGASGGW